MWQRSLWKPQMNTTTLTCWMTLHLSVCLSQSEWWLLTGLHTLAEIGYKHLPEKTVEREKQTAPFLHFSLSRFSSSYNNQWMVVDYKLFTPGQDLPKANLLWVLEQLPYDFISVLLFLHLPSFLTHSLTVFSEATSCLVIKLTFFVRRPTGLATTFRMCWHNIDT